MRSLRSLFGSSEKYTTKMIIYILTGKCGRGADIQNVKIFVNQPLV